MKKLYTARSSIVVRLFISYLLILLIPISLFSAVSIQANRVIEENAIQYNLMMLRQSRDTLESRLTDIWKLVMQLSADTELTNCAYNIESGRQPDYYVIWGLINKLNQLTATNEYIGQAYVTFRSNRMILSTSSFVNLDDGSYVSRHFNGMNEKDYNKIFSENFHQGSYYRVCVSDDKVHNMESLAFIKSFPDNMNDDFYGNIVILLDSSKIMDLMSPARSESNIDSYIFDAEGNLLITTTGEMPPMDISSLDFSQNTGRSFEAQIAGRSMHVSYAGSADSGFRYLTIYPTQQVMSEATYIKNFLLAVLLSSLLFGILISLLCVKNNIRPIYGIIGQLREWLIPDNRPQNEYAMIEHAISGLIQSNQTLQTLTEKQRNAIRKDFLNLLILDGITDNQEAFRIAEQLNLNIHARHYQIALVKTGILSGTIDEERLVQIKLFQDCCQVFLAKQSTVTNLICQLDEMTQMVLMCYSDRDADRIHGMIEALAQQMEQGVAAVPSLNMTIGIGAACDDLINVRQSYREARTATEYVSVLSVGVVWYEDIAQEDMTYNYSPEDQQRILDFVKLGNLNQLENVLSGILKDNLSARSLPFEMQEQLYYEMKGTLVKSAIYTNDASTKEKVSAIKFHAGDVHRSFQELYALLMKIADSSGSRKASHAEKVIEQVKAYIEENYADPDMGLARAASVFNITDVYLSTLFKAQTGENFNTYLEGIRLRSARKLLANSDISVSEIGQKIGYSSGESFRRAFKRKEGISPSEYRNLQSPQSGRPGKADP